MVQSVRKIIRRFCFILPCLMLGHSVAAQTILKGRVLNESSHEPIPFASIGVRNKAIGTVCDESGTFELAISNPDDADSLKISAIGFKTKAYVMAKARLFVNEQIVLVPSDIQLAEVKVKPAHIHQKILGVQAISKHNCSALSSAENGNWKGKESAIKAGNKKGQLVFIDAFTFYIIKNKLADSVVFRLNFYKIGANGMPGENILRKPVIFKTIVKEGLVHIDLSHELISTDDDFFISLECLSDTIDMSLFCFAGEVSEPSYLRDAAFMNWGRVKGGGLAFNVTVSYSR